MTSESRHRACVALHVFVRRLGERMTMVYGLPPFDWRWACFAALVLTLHAYLTAYFLLTV